MIVKEIKKEKKVIIDGFLARDKNGNLCCYLSSEKPTKDKHQWHYEETKKDDDFLFLPNDIRNDITWKNDEPVKIKITIEDE